MRTITIKAQSDADAYWITVDKTDVELWGPRGNATGTLNLPAGPHTLFWGMFGDPGEKLAIEVYQDDQLLTGLGGKIPAGEAVDGGFKPFGVQP